MSAAGSWAYNVALVENVAVVAGPALGALLLLVGPPALAFAVYAVSFVWSALVMDRIRARSRPVDVSEGGNAGPIKQMLVGFRAIAGSATVTMLVAYSVVASFAYGVDTVQFVVLSQERLGTAPLATVTCLPRWALVACCRPAWSTGSRHCPGSAP